MRPPGVLPLYPGVQVDLQGLDVASDPTVQMAGVVRFNLTAGRAVPLLRSCAWVSVRASPSSADFLSKATCRQIKANPSQLQDAFTPQHVEYYVPLSLNNFKKNM